MKELTIEQALSNISIALAAFNGTLQQHQELQKSLEKIVKELDGLKDEAQGPKGKP